MVGLAELIIPRMAELTKAEREAIQAMIDQYKQLMDAELDEGRKLPYAHTIRELSLLDGRAVCRGDHQCIAIPTQKCAAERHEVCKAHGDRCVICARVSGDVR